METIFTKIINGEIPSTQLYTDDRCIVILDIAPVHKGHALVISREPYPTTETCPDDLLGHMMKIARKLDISMRKKIGAEATNIIINNGPAAGQEVPHLHIHVIPRFAGDGKQFIPKKEQYHDGEIQEFQSRLLLV